LGGQFEPDHPAETLCMITIAKPAEQILEIATKYCALSETKAADLEFC